MFLFLNVYCRFRSRRNADTIVHDSSDESSDDEPTGPQRRKLQLEENMDDYDLLGKPSFKTEQKAESKTSHQEDPLIRINSEGKIVVQEETRKRKLEDEDEGEGEADVRSQARSHASSATSKGYRPGGRGIHRALDREDASGRDYKSRKGRSDEKRKGVSVDPFAYVPLKRAALNKRRKVSTKGQFKKLVSRKNAKD